MRSPSSYHHQIFRDGDTPPKPIVNTPALGDNVENNEINRNSRGRSIHSRAVHTMRLIKQDIIERDGSGTITLFPEEPEDMVSFGVLPSILNLTLNLRPRSGTPTT